MRTPLGVYPLRWAIRSCFDVRKFADEQKLSKRQALEVGLKQKAREFAEKGARVYSKIYGALGYAS